MFELALPSEWRARFRRLFPPTREGCAQRTVTLARHAAWRWLCPVTAVVACVEGTLWITVEGDPHDYLLEPGQTLDIARDRLVIASALEDSVLRVGAEAR